MWAWLEKVFLGDLTDGWKQKPLLLVPSKAEMKKMTKKDLEKMGRKHKLELDRRLTKDKLVNQLHKHMKNLNK